MAYRGIIGLWLMGLTQALAQAVPVSGEWRLVLLKPKDCYACTLVEEGLKRKAALQRVTLADDDGAEVTAAIERRSDPALSPQEWAELGTLPYFNRAQWDQQARQLSAQVLLKQDGRIVAAGTMNDSLDLRAVSFPDELTQPDKGASLVAVRGGYSRFYQDLFVTRWNLDWFFRLARHPALASQRGMAAWLARRPAITASPLPPVNVVLASTGNGAVDNPIFNAIRSEEIRRTLAAEAGVGDDQIQVLYGSGTQPGPNALEQKGESVRFVRRELAGARPFMLQTLAEVFERAGQSRPTRNLVVLIGHGGPEGAPMWSQAAALGAEEMTALHRLGGGDDVLVSGNCYGGVLAHSSSCGFFGARPDTLASGCQADAAVVAESNDYLKVFFESLSRARRSLANFDGDDSISFEEAHWEASLDGDARNVTYSTVDALADDYFAAHPADLPAELPVSELQKLAEHATPAERAAFKRLAYGLEPGYGIPLRDLADQATRYSEKPEGPRPMLGQLAHRLLYTQRYAGDNAELAQAQACGSRSIKGFLSR